MPTSSPDPQLFDVVERTNRVVDESARQAATAIAFQEIAQSMALAVQSGVEHLQSVLTVNVAATGAALARLLADPGREAEARAALEESQKAVKAALDQLSQLAATAAKALEEFPKGGKASPAPAAPSSPRPEAAQKK